MNRLLKFIPLCIACLYPSIAMAHYTDGLMTLAVAMYGGIAIFVIFIALWLIPYSVAKNSNLSGLFSFNILLDSIFIILNLFASSIDRLGNVGNYSVLFIVILLGITIIMFNKRSKDLKIAQIKQFQKHGSPPDGTPISSDVYTKPQIKSILEPVFAKYAIKSVSLLGDYAAEKANPNSSVDILVSSELDEWALNDFHKDVTIALRKDVNLLDARQLDSICKSVIQTNCHLIYEQPKQTEGHIE